MTTISAGAPVPTTGELAGLARTALRRCGADPGDLPGTDRITASSPLTGEALFDVPAGTPAEVEAAIQAAQDGKPDTEEQLWQQVQAIWSLAWSANYAALTSVQDAGLSRFSPARPQRWVAASFEHHRGPHGRPHPHIHNIVITTLTTGAC